MTHGLNSHVTKGKELKVGKAEEKKQESTRVSGRGREGVKCQVSSVTVSDAAVRIRSRMNKKGGPAVAPKTLAGNRRDPCRPTRGVRYSLGESTHLQVPLGTGSAVGKAA